MHALSVPMLAQVTESVLATIEVVEIEALPYWGRFQEGGAAGPPRSNTPYLLKPVLKFLQDRPRAIQDTLFWLKPLLEFLQEPPRAVLEHFFGARSSKVRKTSMLQIYCKLP